MRVVIAVKCSRELMRASESKLLALLCSARLFDADHCNFAGNTNQSVCNVRKEETKILGKRCEQCPHLYPLD